MFGDALSLSGISPVAGFAAGENAALPTFAYGAGMAGNSTAAQAAYQSCMAKGGTGISCGASAWQAGLNSGTQITKQTDCSTSWWPAGCTWLHSGDSLQPEIDGLISKKGTGTDLGSELKSYVPSVVTILVGVLFIGAALFLLKSPIQIVSGAVKEGLK